MILEVVHFHPSADASLGAGTFELELRVHQEWRDEWDAVTDEFAAWLEGSAA